MKVLDKFLKYNFKTIFIVLDRIIGYKIRVANRCKLKYQIYVVHNKIIQYFNC